MRGRPPGGQAVRVWVGGRDAQAVGGREREGREDEQEAHELRAVGGVLSCVSDRSWVVAEDNCGAVRAGGEQCVSGSREETLKLREGVGEVCA